MSTRSAAKVEDWRRSTRARPRAQRPEPGRVLRASRPAGVLGPEVEGSVSSLLEFRESRDPRSLVRNACPTMPIQSRLRVPPAMLESDVRLTDRGLAVVMSLAIILIVVALVCITTTAVRVTAEPSIAPVGKSARTAR